jgi:hypothetical protein
MFLFALIKYELRKHVISLTLTEVVTEVVNESKVVKSSKNAA